MALDFGLIQSNLFTTSDALGEGMGAGINEEIVKDSGGAFRELLEVTLTGDAATISLTNIPEGYKYLRVLGRIAYKLGGENVALRFNADAGNTYDRVFMHATTAAISGNQASAQTSLIFGGTGGAADKFGQITMEITNKATETKTVSVQSGLYNIHNTASGQWLNTTSRITSITIFASAGNIAAGSRLTLYGAP